MGAEHSTASIPDPASDKETFEAMERHVAGATVVHANPFKGLPTPKSYVELDLDFITHWVRPLYMEYGRPESDPIVDSLWPEMNRDVAYAMLAPLNWRPRSVGALVVALRSIHELTEEVGNLLLRSDVCCVGMVYCLALAQLNTPRARQFLHQYLDYYLTRHDLDFDQRSAMAAVAYLDQVNDQQELELFRERWDSFADDKRHRNLESHRSSFFRYMDWINAAVARHRE